MRECSTRFIKRDAVKIVPLLPEHADAVSRLHIEGIHMGFISSLGLDFVTVLYRAITRCNKSFGYVVMHKQEIIGFAAFTTNLNHLYKSILLKSGIRFVYLLASRNFPRTAIRNAFETLSYPRLFKESDLPKAEFLAMVLVPEARGKGLATRLLRAGFDECTKRGISKIKTLSAAAIRPINVMYKYYGFQVIKQIEHHGILSNVYVISTDHFSEQKYLRQKSPDTEGFNIPG